MLWMCGASLGWDIFQWCFSRAGCAVVQMNALQKVGWCTQWLYRCLAPDPYGYNAFDHFNVSNSTGGSGSMETEGHGVSTLWSGFVAGYVFFTFFEWAVHKYFFRTCLPSACPSPTVAFFCSPHALMLRRFLFLMDHADMHTTSVLGNMVHFIFHGSHHLSPQDHMRLVFPPVGTVLVRSALAWSFMQFCAQDRATYYAAMGGVYFGYLMYDMMHYGNHHKIPIPGMHYVHNLRAMKQIKHHHLRHHFGDDYERVAGDCNFGLSIGASVWDDIMGTVCSERDPSTGQLRKQSKIRRVLGLDQAGGSGWMSAEQMKLD
jgi:hypothetical protein